MSHSAPQFICEDSSILLGKQLELAAYGCTVGHSGARILRKEAAPDRRVCSPFSDDSDGAFILALLLDDLWLPTIIRTRLNLGARNGAERAGAVFSTVPPFGAVMLPRTDIGTHL